MKYIDIHSHLNFSDYDSDREETIARAREADVGIITVGTDLKSSRDAVVLAEKHENMWAVVGLHPTEAGEVAGVVGKDEPFFDYESFKKLAIHPKVVAIGECGLDYFHTKNIIDRQRKIFLEHIRLANEVNKPLMLHIRNAKNQDQKYAKNGTNAYADAIEILKKHARVSANFHFFAGTLDDLKNILDCKMEGNAEAICTVSFTGVITFARDYDELIRTVPLHRIMSETDSPFVSPAPYRGHRNEPAHVVEVAKKIAEIRKNRDEISDENVEINGENADAVARIIVGNAKKFFHI